jgi:hypothetical protein
MAPFAFAVIGAERLLFLPRCLDMSEKPGFRQFAISELDGAMH